MAENELAGEELEAVKQQRKQQRKQHTAPALTPTLISPVACSSTFPR